MKNWLCMLAVWGSAASVEEQSLTSLMTRTRQMRDALTSQSLSVEHELEKVIAGAKPKPSLVETESLATQKKKFETQQASLLERDAQSLAERKQIYLNAISRLQTDAARLGDRK